MKKTFNILGIVTGGLIVIFGLYVAFGVKINFFKSYTGTNPNSYIFGADFYTEEYEATRAAAENIYNYGKFMSGTIDSIVNLCEFSFTLIGIFISLIGCVVICCFGSKLEDTKNNISKSIQISSTKDSSEELPEI